MSLHPSLHEVVGLIPTAEVIETESKGKKLVIEINNNEHNCLRKHRVPNIGDIQDEA